MPRNPILGFRDNTVELVMGGVVFIFCLTKSGRVRELSRSYGGRIDRPVIADAYGLAASVLRDRATRSLTKRPSS